MIKAVVVAVAFTALLAGCGSSGAKTAETVTVTAGASSGGDTGSGINNPPPSSSSTPPPKQEVPFGGTVSDGTFKFKVTSAKHVSSIPVPYSTSIKAKPGTNLVRVDLVVTNTGNTPTQDPFCGGSGAVLVDTAGRNFGWNDSQTLQMDNGGGGVCGDNLQPLDHNQMTLLFDVPKAAAKLSNIALWDSNDSNDPDGQSYGVIDL